MFDRVASTVKPREVIDDLRAAAREENRAAARRAGVAAELFEMRRAERGEAEDWAVDAWAAAGAEIAAAARISLGRAGSWMNLGLALRRLPSSAAVFAAGDIDAQTFGVIAARTELVTDTAALAEIDQRIAVWAAGWLSFGRGRLIREIDRIVVACDPDAVRRTEERTRGREVSIFDYRDGTAEVTGLLLATDAHLLDTRLDELAATVCQADPRTVDQRRADAMGALAAGARQLSCRCDRQDCPAGTATVSGVVIHVVATQETLDGVSENPGYLLGVDALIPAEMLREIAAQARLRPLISPVDCPAEEHYRPSRALADFVRARDLTCRAPGCDRPATNCDLDHTVPYGSGGSTHASNLKALCRFHHILKTFWGWRDRQLPDGTVIWELPGGRIYITKPGSTLLFPALVTPTPKAPEGDRCAMMPSRKTTRSADRAHRIAAERAANHAAHKTCKPSTPSGQPPPF